jgi:hypothetical protein
MGPGVYMGRLFVHLGNKVGFSGVDVCDLSQGLISKRQGSRLESAAGSLVAATVRGILRLLEVSSLASSRVICDCIGWQRTTGRSASAPEKAWATSGPELGQPLC